MSENKQMVIFMNAYVYEKNTIFNITIGQNILTKYSLYLPNKNNLVQIMIHNSILRLN